MTKRKTAEEILDGVLNEDLRKSIVTAMKKYAEQEALGFHFWLNGLKKDDKIGNRGLMKLWWDYKHEQ